MKPTGKQIRDAVAYWQTVCGLSDWHITVKIGRLPEGDYGSADVDLPYKRLLLRFWPQGMYEAREGVDEMALHELVHRFSEALAAKALKLCRTERDRKEVEDLEEELTTDIERLVLRLHKRPRSD